MVEIKDEEFNHIYSNAVPYDDVEIGDAQGAVELSYIEFYEKSLAMTNDLKRLPMIRAIEAIMDDQAIIAGILASGHNSVEIALEVWNGNQVAAVFGSLQDEDLLYRQTHTVEIIAAGTALRSEHNGGFIPKESSILGKDRLTIMTQMTLPGVAAGAAYGHSNDRVFVEIDWKDITKKQLDDYIRESWFRDDD